MDVANLIAGGSFLIATSSPGEVYTLDTRAAVEPVPAGNGPLAGEWHQVEMAKRAAVFVAGPAVLQYGEKLQEQQEVLAWIADPAIEIFAAESGLLRALH